jgi:NTP pyrophosphatase (non-canonical NTP hydrolase)
MTNDDLTIKQLTEDYKEVGDFLNTRWPLKDKNQQIFARTMKIVEELGELADEILTSMNLARDTKIANFSRENMEDEFADVLASLVLLANELDIDIEKVIKKKLKFTKDRFGMEN